MKRFKGLLVFVLLFLSVFFINSSRSLASTVQYTGNVIPAMTSNTAPSGVSSASSSYSSNYLAYFAFDHDSSSDVNGWVTQLNVTTGWLAYEFSEVKCITKYTMVSRTSTVNAVGQMPKNWTFEAWDELSSSWIVLDTRSNVTDWSYNTKKEFTFLNTNLHKKYRINITANCGNTAFTSMAELEMMETVSTPENLTATVNNTNADLKWSSVTNPQYYNIKRSTTPGGPYDNIITTSSAINFTDKDLEPGTYYYVVSAVVSGTESANSNEVSVTITDDPVPTDHIGNTSTLILTMTNGGLKSYDLSINDLDEFLTWYDNRSNGTGKTYYVFNKTTSIAPYVSIKEYISFDKISSFEVKEFNQ